MYSYGNSCFRMFPINACVDASCVSVIDCAEGTSHVSVESELHLSRSCKKQQMQCDWLCDGLGCAMGTVTGTTQGASTSSSL